MIPGYSWRDPRHLLACGFGAGLAPRAPGTFGTLVALPLYALLHGASLPLYLAAVAALFALGVHVCDRTGRDLGDSDHPAIVFDEIVGYLVTMIGAPAGWGWAIVGFVLFRLFDIVKPWPASVADRAVHGGLGAMLDDVLAGIYAALALQLAWRLAALA